MDGLHEGVRRGGDDRAGHQVAFGAWPCGEQSREDEDPIAAPWPDVEGLLPRSFGFPLVEPTGGDQAAAMAKGTTEGGFGLDPLGSGIDGARPVLRVLGPTRNQTPLGKAQNALALLRAHHDDPLAWGDVVAPLFAKARQPSAEGPVCDLLGGGVQAETSAHAAQGTAMR